MIRVYYNSACPVCNAGIEGQKSRMDGCEVDWIDIHRHPEELKAIGAAQEFVRERLHVVDEEARVRVGADAFGALWKRTPGQRALARIVELPLLRTLSRWAYNAFARALYAWNRAHRRW